MNNYGKIKKMFDEGQWSKFLRKITISNLHGFNDTTIEFRFPVCAIIGENGIGKSTFLKAAACAYKNKNSKDFYPSKLFVNTQWDEKSIKDAEIFYKIIEGDAERETSWKKKTEWGYSPREKKPIRNVYLFDVSRILPLDATVGYAKIASESLKEISSTSLSTENLKELSNILGREYIGARFVNTDVATDKEVGILSNDFGEVSQFHQGAGEDATLDLFKVFQNIPEYSLLIIDELEASLHPKAQRKLTNYLIEIARIKKLQIIISTHSPFVLENIPEEGRILLYNTYDGKKVMYNSSVNFSLNKIDDAFHRDFYVFVEDDFAKILIENIIRLNDKNFEILPRIEIKDLGDYNIVKTIGKLLYNNKLPYRGLAFVDGDVDDDKFINKEYFKLPGNGMPPEKLVLYSLKEKNWNKLSDKFNIGAATLYQIFNDALLLPNHHNWITYIGDKIYQSKNTVWEYLVEEWVKVCASVDDINLVLNPIKDMIANL